MANRINLPDVFHLNDQGKAECFNPNEATEEEIQLQAICSLPSNLSSGGRIASAR